MSARPNVLIVDDQVGEILWLLALLDNRGYDVNVVANEKDGNAALDAIHAGTESYVAAIFDVMVSTLPIEEIIASPDELDDEFYRASKDTGLRLCHRARQLELTLPIACLTVRQDAEVKALKDDLEIPVFHRVPLDESESIMTFLDKHLPPLPGSKALE